MCSSLAVSLTVLSNLSYAQGSYNNPNPNIEIPKPIRNADNIFIWLFIISIITLKIIIRDYLYSSKICKNI